MSEDASLRAAAYEQGRIFQAERDIQITEHHHHGAEIPSASATGPASVRVALSPPLRAALRDREELREELLASVGSGGGVHVLHGFGGCGKTAVARWLFDRTASSRVALWVDASRESQLRAGMLAVAADRGASPEEVRAAQEGRRAAADLVWQRLDDSPEPWLLVLDNADDPKPLRDGWLRTSARGTVLVTSRQADDPAWRGVRARMHRVDVLPVAEAAELLHDLAPGDHQPEATLRLAERLGCHPLALTLAGGFLSQQLLESWTVEEYLERLGEDPVALLDRGAGLESGARERLSRTWQLSLDALAQRGLPEALGVLRLLACLAPAPVPVALLAPSAVLAVGAPGLPAERIEAGLRGLLSASLADLIEVPGYGGRGPVRCVTAHGLLLETVAAGVPRQQRAELFAAVARLVNRAVPQTGEVGNTRLVEPHLLTLLKARSTAGQVVDAARRVRDAHDSAGQWADALPFAAGVVEATAQEGKARGIDKVADLMALGKIIVMMGDFAGAEPIIEEALDAATAWAEESPLLLAQAQVQAVVLYGRRGRSADALKFGAQAYETRQRLLGPTHADTAEAIHLQVESHFHLGNFGEAVQLAQRLVDLLPRLHGQRSDEVAALALLNCAAAMREALIAARGPQALVDDAVRALSWDQVWELSRETVRTYVAHFGPSHPLTATARHNFAVVCWERGDKEAAIGEIRAVVDFRTSVLGEHHPFTIQATADLARMMGLNGDMERASSLAARAHADALRLLGADHFITRLCRDALRPAERVSWAELRRRNASENDRRPHGPGAEGHPQEQP
ncbi:tetratricopeptide repeat protein [Streptomyces sp. NPDC039016]|uniref:tetratricopeptide repeat protein n=1 Tax=Streptomyces sp. NPDC039016 TaxID=3154330 RepID=UPI00340991FD